MHPKFPNTLFLLLLLACLPVRSQEIRYPQWKEGVMELHHISTGRGNASFCILPDGTTLLVDAGDTSETHPRTLSARNTPLLPNRDRSAPEWIVDYIKQFFPQGHPLSLDYALLTHYHDDHFGEVDSTRAVAQNGGYQLTGITEVGHLLPIKTVLDRGTDFPVDLTDPEIQKDLDAHDEYHMVATLKNYWNFCSHHHQMDGMQHTSLIPGRLDQISLKNPDHYPQFHISNIAVNGKIWTGEKEAYTNTFSLGEYPGENPLSTVIKISYGPFDYYTGGDINGVDENGNSAFDRMESLVAPVVGPVDVATMDHHGNRDSQNTYFVRTLRPRVWIGMSWSSDHPDNNVLRRLLSPKIYPGERDLFATAMVTANKEVIGGIVNQYKALHGHIVVRVYDQGKHYEIYVLNEQSPKREVLAKYGPYESR